MTTLNNDKEQQLEKPARVLDAKGLLCPMPIIRTSQEIKEVPVGGILMVLCTDPGSKLDVPAWAKMTGNELTNVSEEEGLPKVFKFRIKRLK